MRSIYKSSPGETPAYNVSEVHICSKFKIFCVANPSKIFWIDDPNSKKLDSLTRIQIGYV